MDALGTLTRLARREVDEERHALSVLDRRRAALQDQIDELSRDAAREIEAAERLPGGPMLLASYLAARRERASVLRRELEALDRQRLAQLERLAARRLEARRLERLVERRRAAAERLATQREMKAIEDIVTARAARREPC
jgi:hypothetical protein